MLVEKQIAVWESTVLSGVFQQSLAPIQQFQIFCLRDGRQERTLQKLTPQGASVNCSGGRVGSKMYIWKRLHVLSGCLSWSTSAYLLLLTGQ